MIGQGDPQARLVLRLNRRTTALVVGWPAFVAVLGSAEILLGLHRFGLVLVLAAAVPLTFGGWLAVRNALAADRLADLPGGPAAESAAWLPVSFVLGLVLACALLTVTQTVRDATQMQTPATATVDSCLRAAKGVHCSGHWTVDGRTYTGSHIADRSEPGATVTVRYAPGDPAYVRTDDTDRLFPTVLIGGLGLLAVAGLFPTARREWRARRGYLAAVRQAAAGSRPPTGSSTDG